MRPTTLLLGLLFLANSCAVSHPPAPVAQPPPTVDVPAAAPVIEPTTTADAPVIKPTVPVEAPSTTSVFESPAPVEAPPAAPVIKPATPVEAASAPPLINPVGPGTGSAGAQAELSADAAVDQVLDALDQRGQSMREFTATVRLTSGDKLLGDLSTRVGQMTFQKKGADDGRLRVVFEKRIDGKVTRDEKTEYLLDDGWLVERDNRKKAETKTAGAQAGRKNEPA